MAAPFSAGAAALRTVTLDDKYELESGRVYVTGVQALVRVDGGKIQNLLIERAGTRHVIHIENRLEHAGDLRRAAIGPDF